MEDNVNVWNLNFALERSLEEIHASRNNRRDPRLLDVLYLVNSYLNVPNPQDRQGLWKPKLSALVVELLQENGHLPEVYAVCFSILSTAVKTTAMEREDPSLFHVFDFCVENLGVIELIAKELAFTPYRGIDVVERALILLTGFCLLPRHALRICESGMVDHLLKLSQDATPQIRGVYALISLTNLAIHPVSHSFLFKADVTSVAVQLLHFLQAPDTRFREIDCGLSAAFLICRVVGTHERGPGPDAIHMNNLLLSRLYWIFDAVLAAAPRHLVIGSSWNPANIAMDVATLAVSDRNKPLLAKFIPLLIQGLQSYHRTNYRFVQYAVEALIQLVLENGCREAIIANTAQLLEPLEFATVSPAIDIRTMQKASVLRSLLLE